MDIVIDTSALIAVIAGEPERAKIIEITTGNTLIGPGSVPWEIGNAFSAMYKQKRLSLKKAKGISTLIIRAMLEALMAGLVARHAAGGLCGRGARHDPRHHRDDTARRVAVALPYLREHWHLVAITVAVSLVGVVLWGTVSGSMLPFVIRLLGADPASVFGAVDRYAGRRFGPGDLLRGGPYGSRRDPAVTASPGGVTSRPCAASRARP